MNYQNSYNYLLEKSIYGTKIKNKRTNQNIRYLRGGEMIKINLKHGLPIPNNRVYNVKTPLAESAWFFTGDKSIKWFKNYSKIWNKFAKNNKIESAYGFRTKYNFGTDQLKNVINELKKDISSRQCVINLWDCNYDLLKLEPAPCPTQFIFNSDGKSLDMQIVMRSSDLFVGLPYDIMFFSLICDALSTTLNLENGFLTLFLAHPHIYEAHIDLIQSDIIHNYIFELPGWSISQIINSPDKYVNLSNKLFLEPLEEQLKIYPEVFE